MGCAWLYWKDVNKGAVGVIENIEDHMAKICECGSVNFILLKSGKIECSKCLQKKDNEWMNNMKNNETKINTIESKLLNVVNRIKTANKSVDFSNGKYEEIILDIESICSEIASNAALLKEVKYENLRHVGYTNGYQLAYNINNHDEAAGLFYPDSDCGCIIPLYMLKDHDHRIATTTDGEVTAEMLEKPND